MLEALLFIAIITLCVIAHQLHGLRSAVERNAIVSDLVRHQQELDEKILFFCPNIFHELRPELREWFAIHEREKERCKEQLATYSELSREEESNWPDIQDRLWDSASDDQKKRLMEMASVTESFFKQAAETTVLTPAESEFFAFRAWRDQRESSLTSEIFQFTLNSLQEKLARHIARHRRIVVPQSEGTLPPRSQPQTTE